MQSKLKANYRLLRIAFISYEFPPDTGKGGIGTYTGQVAGLMVRQGAEVHVFCGSPYRMGQEYTEGYQVHRIACVSGDDFREKVTDIFGAVHAQQPFDIIESPEINSNAAGIKKTFPSIPLVVRLHAPGYLVESLKKKYYPLSAKLRFVAGALKRGRLDAGYWKRYDFENDADYQFCKTADAITAPSQAMKNWAVQHWLIKAKDITVIPNPFLPPGALLQLPVAEKAVHKQIVFFGRLNVLKGLVNATLAMRKILKEFPLVHFKVIGDDGPGPVYNITMRQWMQQQLKDVIEQVSFTDGFSYEHLPAAIAEAEIALLPSLFESFSYTCAEAMAAGKAVIGSEGTGMDFIRHNISGILVSANNPAAVYNAVKSLVLDDALRCSLAENARTAIREMFSDKILGDAYLEFYTDAVAKNTSISFS